MIQPTFPANMPSSYLLRKAFMNRLKIVVAPSVMLLIAMLCSALTCPVLSAQTTPPRDQSTSEQNPKSSTTQNPPMRRFDMKVYTGFINKLGGQYMLTAPWSNMMYKLDNQQEAKKFNGQEVAVTGELDPKTSVIRVKSIASASKPKS